MPSFDTTESINVEIEFEVYCSCGYGLCNQSDATSRNGRRRLDVEPCPRCIAAAKDDGREERQPEIDALQTQLDERE